MARRARTTASLASALAVTLTIASAACVGDDPVGSAPATDGGGPGTGGDGSTTGDGGGPDGCTPGTKTCADGTTLATCGQTATETCALECSTTGGAHCTVLQPNVPVTAADLATADVVPVTISADAVVDTATGSIEGLRPANADPSTQEMKSGIAFRLVGNVGVFIVKSFKVSTGVTLKLRGPAAFALVAAETIEIVGVVDARGYDVNGVLCGVPGSGTDTAHVAGPGGSPGGIKGGSTNGVAPGAGGGKGVSGFTAGATEGPGGGGFGGTGGNGGGYANSGGAIVAMPSPIAGGFGGGASSLNGGSGGGGGGAVQLVAGATITIGGGPNPGGINAGGCGGTGGAFGEAGSGGGSGGAILLQSPVVTIKALGVLAANGGAGSTGSAAARGEHGKLGKASALGPPANGGYGKGGDGAPRVLGGSLESPLSGEAGGAPTGNKGGGGGGGGGRIRIENRSGSVSVPADGVVSPAIETGPAAATTVGAVSTK